jgi:hypothetical protein
MLQKYEFWPSKPTIRIDDISTRTDPERLEKFLEMFSIRFQNFEILLAVSIGTIHIEEDPTSERVFPPIFNAMSDHRVFFNLTEIGSPSWLPAIVSRFNCKVASHGLFHVDHRLLSKEAQEISIISSCSAIGTKIFVPPFNKYNPETIEVIKESKLQLVVWESGWKHLGYQKLDQAAGNYYFHMHDFNDKQLLSLLI